MKIPRYNVAFETARLMTPSLEGANLELGIRESRDLNALSADDGKKLLCCLGGSTTYCVGNREEFSWPRLLESPSCKVINAGASMNSLFDSFIILILLIKRNVIPSKVIFFDGVNQRAGYTNWNSNQKQFSAYSSQYLLRRFHLLDSLILESRIWTLITLLFGKFGRRIVRKVFSDSIEGFSKTHFLGALNAVFRRIKESPAVNLYPEQEALDYLAIKKIVVDLCQAYEIQPIFLLQPCLGDVDPKFAIDNRFLYLKSVYSHICSKDSSIVDLSNLVIGLESEDFLDWQHLSEEGNHKIAKTIKEILL